MKLIVVDQETHTISESFGISPEREIELRDLVARAARKAVFDIGYDQRHAAVEIAENCNDLQEYTVCLMWVVPAISHFNEKMRAVFSGIDEK